MRTGEQTDGHDVANSRFSQFCERAKAWGHIASSAAGKYVRTWQATSQCTLPAMLAVNLLQSFLMMSIEFRTLLISPSYGIGLPWRRSVVGQAIRDSALNAIISVTFDRLSAAL